MDRKQNKLKTRHYRRCSSIGRESIGKTIRGYQQKTSWTFCLTVSEYRKKSKGALLVLLVDLVFLKVCGFGNLYQRQYHNFSSTRFCLTVPKNFVRETFCVFESFWYRKKSSIEEGLTIFHRRSFCLTEPKILVKWTFLCLWVLIYAWHRLHLHALKYYAGKTIRKSRKFVVSRKVPSASESCYPAHCAMATVGISDKFQWNHKEIWHDRDSDMDLLLEKILS